MLDVHGILCGLAVQALAAEALDDMDALRATEGCCEHCGAAFKADGMTTGYGTRPNGCKICYDCCSVQDKASMRADGAATLYLVKDAAKGWQVTNWPGSLAFRAWGVRKVSNGYTAYFTLDRHDWIVRNQGDMDAASCRRLKHRVR